MADVRLAGYVLSTLQILREDCIVLTRVEPRITSSLIGTEFFYRIGMEESLCLF